jgi:hypothetical protein
LTNMIEVLNCLETPEGCSGGSKDPFNDVYDVSIANDIGQVDGIEGEEEMFVEGVNC